MANEREFLPPDVVRKARNADQMQAALPFGLDFPATQVGVVGNMVIAHVPAGTLKQRCAAVGFSG